MLYVALPLGVASRHLFVHSGSASNIKGFSHLLVALPHNKLNRYQENNKWEGDYALCRPPT